MKKLNLIIGCALSISAWAQGSGLITEEPVKNNFELEFSKAYKACPNVPKGVLEAVSFVNTRFEHLIPEEETHNCSGMPSSYGIMGLKLDGKTVFNNNASLIAAESHISINDIVTNPEKQILAYALAYTSIKNKLGITSNAIEQQLPVLTQLSDLKEGADLFSNFALESSLFDMMTFLDNDNNSTLYHFPDYKIDLVSLFGQENYNIHTAKTITLDDEAENITNENGDKYSLFKAAGSGTGSGLSTTSVDYAPAIWNPAATCNMGGTRPSSVTHVVIHTTQGSYSGTISWFKNCAAKVSAHYVIKSSSGQVTQMVSNNRIAYHIGGNNNYTIGIEHEGYVSSSSWYTNTMYIASAKLVRNILAKYGISRSKCYNGVASAYYSPNSSTYRVKGHQHFVHPSKHTDPGKFWSWSKYYNYVNASSLKVASDNLSNNKPMFLNSLYPNPAINKVTISFEDKNHDLPVFVEVLSLDGRLVMQQEIPASVQYEEFLNVENLNSGMYLVKITNGDVSEFKRLQVER